MLTARSKNRRPGKRVQAANLRELIAQNSDVQKLPEAARRDAREARPPDKGIRPPPAEALAGRRRGLPGGQRLTA